MRFALMFIGNHYNPKGILGLIKKHPVIYVPLIFLFFMAIIYFAILATPLIQKNSNMIVSIQSGASLHEIAVQLQAQNIIDDPTRFILASKMMLKGRKMRAGRFNLKRAANYYELIKTLCDWDIETVRVTIPEGLRVREIALLLQNQIGVSAEEFVQKALDRNFAHEMGIDANTLEGYLFPDSYDFLEGDSPEYVIYRMVSRFREVVNDSVRTEIRKTGRTLHEIMILASIVEGECQVNRERPIVASIYYNRLRKGMRLESCPTIQYIIPDGPRRILRADLKIDSPYNTYQHYGLPPGPVNNPGWMSIQAAIHPANTKYLFMVANGDSTHTHTFSVNYEDHLSAKKKLQKQRQLNKQSTDKDYVN